MKIPITITIDVEVQPKIKDIARNKLRCSVSKIVNDNFWKIVETYDDVGVVKK